MFFKEDLDENLVSKYHRAVAWSVKGMSCNEESRSEKLRILVFLYKKDGLI